MEILLQDLLPGQEYLLQLRSKNQQGVSQWSRAYSITTDSDITPPSPITSLSWIVSRANFVAEWTKPTTDSDGDPLKDFRDFKITLTASSQTAVFYVTEERFDFSLERNISAFGSPQPVVEIKVETRDTVGNLSTPVTSTATNPIPEDVTGLDATSALGGINFVWNHVSDDDLKNYELYGSSSPAFTPGPSNLRATTAENQLFYATSDTTVQYFKLRAIDLFDQGSASYAEESGQAYPIDGIPDTTAPSQPSAPTISLGTLVAQVSHDMTKQGGGNLESDVDYLEIHASTTTGFTPSQTTLRGTIDSAGLGIPVSSAFYFPSTDSMTNLYWKVIAVDRSKNKSVASNQTTGLPGLIENINILNATITDAKIQNLSAAKLIAGTAIINNLFIESAITVSDTGFLASENFVSETSGWKISADGTVEFNDGTFRGDLRVGTTTNFAFVEPIGGSSPGARMGVEDADGNYMIISTSTVSSAALNWYEPISGQNFGISSNSDGMSIGNRTPFAFGASFGTRNGNGVFFNGGATGRDILIDSDTGYVMVGNAQPWSEETWINATLQNGWTNVGAGFANVSHRLMPDGTVLLRGAANAGTLADGTVLFTLPSGYRPTTIVVFPVQVIGAPAQSRIRIQTNGVVDIFSMTGGTTLRLDSVRFPVI
jgi:hypothetical protein